MLPENIDYEQSDSDNNNSCLSQQKQHFTGSDLVGLPTPLGIELDSEKFGGKTTNQELTECETHQTVYTVDSVFMNDGDIEKKKKKKKKNKKKKANKQEEPDQVISILEYDLVADNYSKEQEKEESEEVIFLKNLLNTTQVAEPRKIAKLSKRTIQGIDKIYRQILAK